MKARDAEQHNIDSMALGSGLTEEQAKAIFAFGEEAVVLLCSNWLKWQQSKIPTS